MSAAAPIKAPLRLPNGKRTLNVKQSLRAWATVTDPIGAIVSPLGYAVTAYAPVTFTHATAASFTLPAAVVVALADTLRPPKRRSKRPKL
jgi:hypothetical protein